MNANNGIVIAYDGSENARHAITVAAAEIGPRHADVVHVWEPLASAGSRLAIYAPMGGATAQELEAEATRAQETADEGARLAREAGFDAEPVTLRTEGPIAAGISFCSMLTACDRAGDVRRAEEWTGIVSGVLAGLGNKPRALHVHCRVAYGSVLCASGRWPGSRSKTGSDFVTLRLRSTSSSVAARSFASHSSLIARSTSRKPSLK